MVFSRTTCARLETSDVAWPHTAFLVPPPAAYIETGGCPTANVVDLVGYGTANCFEGTAAAPAASNTTAVLRAQNGCVDNDQNGSDFAAGPPAPRNSATAAAACN